MPEAGAGYNIPISLSLAETLSIPQTMLSPTYFVFGNDNRAGGDIEQNPQNINPATATSATAQNGDATATTKDAGNVDASKGLGLNQNTLLIIGAIAVGLFLLRNRF